MPLKSAQHILRTDGPLVTGSRVAVGIAFGASLKTEVGRPPHTDGRPESGFFVRVPDGPSAIDAFAFDHGLDRGQLPVFDGQFIGRVGIGGSLVALVHVEIQPRFVVKMIGRTGAASGVYRGQLVGRLVLLDPHPDLVDVAQQFFL